MIDQPTNTQSRGRWSRWHGPCHCNAMRFFSASTLLLLSIALHPTMLSADLQQVCIRVLTDNVNHKIGFPIFTPKTLSSNTDAQLRSLIRSEDEAVLARYDRLQELLLQRHVLEAELKALEEGTSILKRKTIICLSKTRLLTSQNDCPSSATK